MENVRQLTLHGISEAKNIIAQTENSTRFSKAEAYQFLFSDGYSQPIEHNIFIEKREFRSRKNVVEYFRPIFDPFTEFLAERGEIWSWLGMYYLLNNCVDLSNRKGKKFPAEIFVFGDVSTQTYRRRYKHCLWGTWRLGKQHGDSLPFILGRSPLVWSDLEDRAFSKARVFNSIGVIQLMEHLYTRNGKLVKNYSKNRGGLRHLLIVLDQLALTYDVYGMKMAQILSILPPEFEEWATRTK